MGDLSEGERNNKLLSERDPVESLNSKNVQINNMNRSQTRPMPDSFPQLPIGMLDDVPGSKEPVLPNSEHQGLHNRMNLNSNNDLTGQGIQVPMGQNLFQMNVPCTFTAMPQPITNQGIQARRVLPFTGLCTSPAAGYGQLPMAPPNCYQSPRQYQQGYRIPTPQLKNDNAYWNQMFRSKPGSVYSIPSDPRVMQSDYTRLGRQYNIFLQPNAIRVFNDFKYQRPTHDFGANHMEMNRLEEQNMPRDNLASQLSGLVNLPRNFPINEPVHNVLSSQKDKLTHINFTIPEVVNFQKVAFTGCKDMYMLISKYNIKSQKLDLEELSKNVQINLLTLSPTHMKRDQIMRELLLAYLQISNSWVSLASLLPIQRDMQNPLTFALEPIMKGFLEWQAVSKSMLEKITQALNQIVSDDEKYVPGMFLKSNNSGGLLTDNVWSHASAPNLLDESGIPNSLFTAGKSSSSDCLPTLAPNLHNTTIPNLSLGLSEMCLAQLQWNPFNTTLVYQQQPSESSQEREKKVQDPIGKGRFVK